jgi:hypothetical protein
MCAPKKERKVNMKAILQIKMFDFFIKDGLLKE